MADSYRSLIEESFLRIAEESPTAFAAFADTMRGRTVRIGLGDERFGVTGGLLPSVTGSPEQPDVDIAVHPTTVAAVIDADLSLADAITHDLVHARGTLDAVTAAHDALLAFVHGAIRSPSVPELRPRFDALRGVA